MKRTALVLTLILSILFSTAASTHLVNVGTANPSSMIPPPPPLPRIYIKADGNVDPPTAPIQRVESVYTLTRSVSDCVIEVQRDNIVIDGAGYSLTGKPHENGVVLAGRKNVNLKNIVVKNFGAGIYVSGCTDCTIDGSTVTNSSRGIEVSGQSRNNFIRGNALRSNMWGIRVSHSGNNQFRDNAMQDNKYNLEIDVGTGVDEAPTSLSEFANDIDLSNTVDGKPVCYWVNQESKVVPSGCGYVALINCTGITVQNLALSKNAQGILLISTRDSTISQNTITGNGYGIWADSSSSHATIEQNDISGNMDDGISLIGSNNNRIANNSITNNYMNGIRLEDSKGANVVGNTIKANFVGGINLENNSETTISENHIADHKNDMGSGIWLGLSSNDTITRNTIENNRVGMSIHDLSKNNVISGNTVRDNIDGLHFYYTTMYGPASYPLSSNTFRNNRFDNNEHNLRFESSFVQDIDTSNTVNGKPIYYWVNQRDKAVPSDAGYVALVNCKGITIEGVSVSKNWQGLMLFNTTNSLITKSRFSDNNGYGVYVWHSTNNTFSENEILANAEFGACSWDSSDNTFVQNNIAYNKLGGMVLGNTHDSIVLRNNVTSNEAVGIKVDGSKNISILENYVAQNGLGILLNWGTSQCKVIANMITENYGWGIRIEGPKINSTIYHNNFIDNKVEEGLQVSIPWPADPNTWDNGKEGNYWSDYNRRYANASEIGNTGVGNTPYFINENNTDRYPLISPFETSDIDLPAPSTPPSQEPTVTQSPDTQTEPAKLATALLATASATSIAATCIGLLFYFKKRKRSETT